MPELPEVETVRRGLRPAMVNARIDKVELRRGDLRRAFPPRFAAALTGRTVTDLKRRAKYLVAELDDGAALVMHLGMSGSFRIEGAEGTKTPGKFRYPRGKPGAHDHVVLHMSNGAVIVYNDPRRFGLMDLIAAGESATNPLLADLGIEPLGRGLTPTALAKAFAGRRTSIKAVLLDQRLIAGLGNIYVCEALWRAGIAPQRETATLADKAGEPTAMTKRLAEAIPAVLKDAIAAGGSSLRNYVGADGELGSFQHSFAVYGREGEACQRPRCRGVIRRIVQNGRSTFFCPVCQK